MNEVEAGELQMLANAYHWAGYHEGVADGAGDGGYDIGVVRTKRAAEALLRRIEELTNE